MTNKYLEKIDGQLTKEAQRKVMPEAEDYWKHAPKSTATELGMVAGSAGALIHSVRHGAKAETASMVGDRAKSLMHGKKSLKGFALGTGLALGSTIPGIMAHNRTEKALSKKYEVRRRK